MNKKPDTMFAMVVLFAIGLAVTGFSAIASNSDKVEVEQRERQTLSRY